MDVNRRYFVHYARQVAAPGATVLDYGCGSGELVELLSAAGFDAYGVDIRWPGGDYGALEASELGERAAFAPTRKAAGCRSAMTPSTSSSAIRSSSTSCRSSSPCGSSSASAGPAG